MGDTRSNISDQIEAEEEPKRLALEITNREHQMALQKQSETAIRDALDDLAAQANQLKAVPNSGERARQLALVRTKLQEALLWLDAEEVLS